MKEWAAEELKYADLGDRRRNSRLVKIVSDLAAQSRCVYTTSFWGLGRY